MGNCGRRRGGKVYLRLRAARNDRLGVTALLGDAGCALLDWVLTALPDGSAAESRGRGIRDLVAGAGFSGSNYHARRPV